MGEWWIEDGNTRIRITAHGILVGRGVRCDIGVRDERVSRRHLFVRLDRAGPVVALVGRNGARVNGRALRPHDERLLADGDRVAIPGRELRVQQTAGAAAAVQRSCFVLHHGDGVYAITHFPFCVGGAASDDLVIPDWPASALCLLSAGETLVVEVRRDVALAGGRHLARGARANLRHGDEVVLAGKRLCVLWRSAPGQTATVDARRAEAPRAVRLQRLPGSGGHLVLEFADGEITASLAERRFDCVHGLLCPPAGHRPGDWIGDDVLASVVWPRDQGKGRVELNVLVSRVRKDLAKHGVDGQALIQRERGSTRFALAPGARVLADDTNDGDDGDEGDDGDDGDD